jgi:signal peptidase I
MADNKYDQNKDLIEDSLDFCKDIQRYYELEEVDKLDFRGYSHRKESPKETKVEKVETIVVTKETNNDEAGLRVYTKIVAIILFALIFVRIVNAYIVEETIVSGTSMNPTLQGSDTLLIDKIFYKVGDLKRFDVIVFDYNESALYIKRIIGLPGDRIKINDGHVYINGSLLNDDPLINDKMTYAGIAENEITLGEDEYFVLGDNRNNSYDSRYEQVGVVKGKYIIGRVWLRIFPISKFGSVN